MYHHYRRRCKVFLSTPSARRATGGVGAFVLANRFLSTPSARRATKDGRRNQEVYDISIHALREEGDKAISLFFIRPVYFYPRPPRGGRLAYRKT